MKIVLRYRDLTVPEGATIERHREIIEREDVVMWGWMMRQSEIVPNELLAKVAEAPDAVDVYLYDSGSCELRHAKLRSLSVFAGGIRIPTPIPPATPTYMAEALCPVWFHITEIEEEPIMIETMIILGYPTLDHEHEDNKKLGKATSLTELRDSGATLWVASFEVPE